MAKKAGESGQATARAIDVKQSVVACIEQGMRRSPDSSVNVRARLTVLSGPPALVALPWLAPKETLTLMNCNELWVV